MDECLERLFPRLHEVFEPRELPEVLAGLAAALGASGAGTLFLIDRDGNWERDFPPELMGNEEAELLAMWTEEEVPAPLRREEAPAWLRAPLYLNGTRRREAVDCVAVLPLPLRFRGELLGLWPLFFDQEAAAREAATAPDLGLLAVHVAAAYVHVNLYRDLGEEAAAAQSKLRAVNEMRAALQRLDLEGVLAKILDSALRVLSAQVGAILLFRDGRWEPGVELGLPSKYLRELRQKDGTLLLDILPETGARLLYAADLAPLGNYQTETLLAAPLTTRKGCLGALFVANAGSDRDFSAADLELVETVVGLAATALENALLHRAALEQERMATQLEVARKVQEGLLPKEAPKIPDIDMAGKSIPCDETGGDYFDYVDVKESAGGRLGLVIADVSSHGVGSALVMAATRSFLRALATDENDPRQLLQRVNLLLERDLQGSHFVTLFFAVLEPPNADGQRRMTYASAGHDSPLLLRADGKTIELESTGLPLGIMPEARYEPGTECFLGAGDLLVLTTDGIWETMDEAEKCYGRERMTTLLEEVRDRSAAEIIDALLQDVAKFRKDAKRRDDETIVVLKLIAPKGAKGEQTAEAKEKRKTEKKTVG